MNRRSRAFIVWARSFASNYIYWPSRLLSEKFLFYNVSIALKLAWVRSRISPRPPANPLALSSLVGTVDNLLALWLTKIMCYSGKDVRAAWPIVGTPFTNVERYRPWARWAHQHLTMYRFFADQITPHSKVLDLGGGIGNMAANIAVLRPDIHMTVIDLDGIAVRIGSDLFRDVPNLKFVNEDARSSPYASRYDFCFMIELLEHVPAESHIGLIETALGALKPNGKLFLSTPNALDQKDEPWGHVGLLNSERAGKVVRIFERQITKFGYLKSEALTSDEPESYSVIDSPKRIGIAQSEYSHYFFELTNR